MVSLPRVQTAAYAIFEHQVQHIYTKTGKKERMDTLLASKDHTTWTTASSNELGRLDQGFGNNICGTNTIDFIHKSNVPSNKKVTYGNFICNYCPLKSKPYWVHLTVGGNKLHAASFLETKLILNSTILDAGKGACFLCANLKDYFLASPMKDPK